MQVTTAFHGSNSLIRNKDEIRINFKSEQQFYGPAFYLSVSIDLARIYGRNLYEVSFTTERLFNVVSSLDVRTTGTFSQFLNMLKRYPEELISETILSDESFDEDGIRNLVEDRVEENIDIYFQEYLIEQYEIRDEFEEEYDGIFDGKQYAIYFPEKTILDLRLI